MIQNIFIQNAADILGDTDSGLTSSQIVKLCSAYACLLYTSDAADE